MKPNKIIGSLFSTLTLIIISFCNLYAADEKVELAGLNLDKVLSKATKRIISVVNPHLSFDCVDCHKNDKVEIKEKKSKEKKGSEPIEDIIKLCESCHEGENLHPVDTNPMESEFKITPPKFLPLGVGKYKDKIVCTTCHDMHLRKSAYKLLRGFPETNEYKTAKLEGRQDLCKSCHGEENLIKRSPHKGDERACKFCHITDPRKTDNPIDTVRLDIVKRCNFCHAKLEEAHFLAVNAFADKALKDEIPTVKLPFIGGEITCVTCHDQHWKSTLPHRLRPEFVSFAEKSVRINPHWTGTFCLSCHDKTPESGKPVTFLFDGDFVEVCNRCHKTVEATADIHPVNITIPPEMKNNIPKDFKLKNGDTITCITCHELTYQTTINNPLRRENPKFLRGGPYENRSDICYRCHERENYQRMSPHQQLDQKGEVIESKCLFCHSSRPDVNVVGIDKVKFNGDVSEFCYGCHDGKNERHPVGVTHQGRKPSEARLKCIKDTEEKHNAILPLFNEAVFCGTCHNPHQQGVMKGEAAARGAGSQNRLRFKEGYEICVACHCDKGGLQ